MNAGANAIGGKYTSAEAERPGVSRARRWMGAAVLGGVLFALYLVQTHQVAYFQVTSGSMEPTLRVGGTYLMLPAKEFARGQVIVVVDPEDHGTLLTKRLVGLPGDTLNVKEGFLYLNGTRNDPPQGKAAVREMNDRTWTLKDGEAFVAGDNRELSYDSREFGPVKLADIRGVLGDREITPGWWQRMFAKSVGGRVVVGAEPESR